MPNLIFDLESDGLLDAITKVHSLQIGDEDGTDAVVYADWPGHPSIDEGIARLRTADKIIGHNLISYDWPVMERFFPGVIRREQLWDTLQAARLFDPSQRMHSLKAWGTRLGVLKGDFKGPWDVLTQDMMDYAAQDVIATRALWHHVRGVLTWGESYQIELDFAHAMDLQETNGFRLNVPAAQRLDLELRAQTDALTAELQRAFPPIRRVRHIVPARDNKTKGYVKGVKAVAKEWDEAFNPSSRQHVAERLQMAGWKPRADSYGDNGVPTVDEKVLAGIKLPEAALILKYFDASKRLGLISDGKNGWLKLVGADGVVHGRVNGNGAVTGRASHMKPNMAQIPKDAAVRSLWGPTRASLGWLLVGCDAEGLEARVMAHYLAHWDNGAFAAKVLAGDFHTANFDVLAKVGMASRNGAKTWLYAFMYGAGDHKLGETIKGDARDNGKAAPRVPSRELGARSREMIAKAMVGIDKLSEAVKSRSKARGYLIGLDGRQLQVRSEHSALNTLLQGGGAVVMKKALQLFMQVHGDHHGTEFALCGNIHDEVQMECRADLAAAYGSSFAGCIREAGEHYKLRCPMAGKAAVGANWSETH